MRTSRFSGRCRSRHSLNRPWNKQPPVVFCSLALTFACAAASSLSAHDGAAAPRIVALGDSLTAGQGIGLVKAYPAVVQEWLDEAGLELTMVNAGVNGDTTSRAVTRLDRA